MTIFSRRSFSPVVLSFILFLFGFPSFLCAEPALQTESPPPPLLITSLTLPEEGNIPRVAKVGLLVEVPSVTVGFDGPYEIRSGTDSKVLAKGADPLEIKMVPAENGIEFNHKVHPGKEFSIHTDQSVRIGRRSYRDQIRILSVSGHALTVVNEIDFEEYLKGVLPLEVSADWPIEALKAHAVVSRTYALFQSLKDSGQDFIFRDNVLSQVYGGVSAHKEATDQAVNLTKGEVLTFQGKIFPAYFHANCGGRTARADQIWAVEPNPALAGVICPFCMEKKHYEWALDIPLSEIEQKMHSNGYPARGLKGIEFLDREESGRARQAALQYERSKLTLPAGDFRKFVGYDRLRSLKADVLVKDGRAFFHGFGWGHGIGFCQWGAKTQAEIGKTYKEILKFYYPNSELTKV